MAMLPAAAAPAIMKLRLVVFFVMVLLEAMVFIVALIAEILHLLTKLNHPAFAIGLIK